MNVLQLCSYYNTTSLYKKMFDKIDEQNESINQVVYIPMAINGRISPEGYGTIQEKTKNYSRISHCYSEAFKKNSRYIYSWKQLSIRKDLIKKIDIKKIDFIHAHSLFVNGGISLYLKKKYKVKYIVAVRETDISTFFKKMPHLRKHGIEIMLNAEKIVFISHNLKKEFFSNYAPKKHLDNLQQKTEVVPNGIDDFWFEKNKDNVSRNEKQDIKLLYAGTLYKRKNVELIISSFEEISSYNPKVELRIIANGPERENIEKQIFKSKYREKIKFTSWTNDINELKEEYQKSDIFIMPSIKETFGIAYLEAMSQGKPIIYTKNEGVDGFFADGEIGYSVETKVYSILEAVNKIIDNYECLSISAREKSYDFSWKDIAEKYIQIYIEKEMEE